MNAVIRWHTRVKTLLLVRFGGINCQNILPIHPCHNCQSVLTELHINVIVYTGE